MKQKIGRKVYDTENAKEVGKQSIGYFGDSYGFEEVLYRKDDKEFFLFCVGGENSQYPNDIIVPMNEADTKEWLVRVCGADYAEQIFAEEPKKAVAKAAPAKTAAAKTTAAKKPVAKKASTASKTTTTTKTATAKATATKTASAKTTVTKATPKTAAAKSTTAKKTSTKK